MARRQFPPVTGQLQPVPVYLDPRKKLYKGLGIAAILLVIGLPSLFAGDANALGCGFVLTLAGAGCAFVSYRRYHDTLLSARQLAIYHAQQAAYQAYLDEQHRRERLAHMQELGHLLTLDPTAFEERVAELLAASGYRQVQRKGGAGDLNADITCYTSAGQFMVVQCKRYAPGSAIGSPVIQTFIGMARIHHHAQAAMFVTTSTFSQPAIELARQHDIMLVDGDALTRWARQVAYEAALRPMPAADTPPAPPLFLSR